ncbi:MAG: pantetheine-phosphate adenylyltransferase, partial [Candidatus Limnocylindrales bacterium]
ADVFDQVVMGVLINPRKSPMLTVEERLETIRRSVGQSCPQGADRVSVEAFDGLTIDFCIARGAGFIVRGLRAVSDFETELQMAHTNRKLAPGVDTVFFMTALEHSYLSSSLVKEIAAFGGDVSRMVPPAAAERLPGTGRGL